MDYLGGACDMGVIINAYKIVVENPERREFFVDAGADGRIKKYDTIL